MCAPGPSCSRTHTRAPAGAMLWLLLSLLRSGPARAVVGPLRVRFDFSSHTLARMNEAAREVYQNSMPEAADYVGRALSVERVEGPLRLARECLIRENDDHCYLRMDTNASKLQKATYLRLWRARFWFRGSLWRKIYRQYRMEVPPVKKMLNRLDGLLVGMFAHYILPPFLLLPVVLYFVVWIPEFLTLASTSPGDVPDLIRRGLSELATL